MSATEPASAPLVLRHAGWSGRFIGLLIGALAVLGHAPFHIWPITLLSLAILFARLQWVAEDPRASRRGFSVALWWGVGYFAAGTFWVGSAFIERGPEFIPIMPFMVAGLAVVLALFWAIAGAWFARMRFSGVWAVLAFTAVFTIAEVARGHIFGGFPWNLPAYIFQAGSAPSQAARWLGAYGLSTLVLLIAAALGQALFWRRRFWAISATVLPLVALYAIGLLRLSNAELEMHPDIRLRIVSVPFKQSDKMNPETSVGITNEFIRASLAPGLSDATHLIWPEGAANGLAPVPAIDNIGLLYAVGSAVSEGDPTPPVWLMNSLATERENGRLRYYNVSAAVTFDAEGNPAVAATNKKYKLVPFGENVPFMDWFDAVQFPLISTNLASISPGDRKRLAEFPGLPRLSPQLCYEVAFPGLTPGTAEAPPAFILNQSNDAWFGRSAGPAQHANIAGYRAIETGLPIIRAASNGVSGQFDPYGRVHGKVAVKDMSHLDTELIKPLKFNEKIKYSGFLALLLSVLTCAITAVIGRGSVGLLRQTNLI